MSRRSTQLIGLILWRGGLLFVAAAAMFEVSRRVLKYIAIPTQLEVGFGLALAGFGLIILSLIFERIRDAKAEGDLLE